MIKLLVALLMVFYCSNAFASYVWFMDVDGIAYKVDLVNNNVLTSKQIEPSKVPTLSLGNNKNSVATSDQLAFIVANTDNGRTINVFRKEDLTPLANRIVVSTDDAQEYPIMAPLKDKLFVTWGELIEEDDVLHGAFISYDKMTTVVPVNKVIEIAKMTCIGNDKSSFYDVDVMTNTIEQFDKDLILVSNADISAIWGSGDSNRAIEHCLDNKFLFVQYFKSSKETFYYPYDYSAKKVLNKIKVADQGLGMLLPNNRLLIAGTKTNKGMLNIYDVLNGQKIVQVDLRASFDDVVYLSNGIISPDSTRLFAVGKNRTTGKKVVISVHLTTFKQKVLLEGFEPVFFVYGE